MHYIALTRNFAYTVHSKLAHCDCRAFVIHLCVACLIFVSNKVIYLGFILSLGVPITPNYFAVYLFHIEDTVKEFHPAVYMYMYMLLPFPVFVVHVHVQ